MSEDVIINPAIQKIIDDLKTDLELTKQTIADVKANGVQGAIKDIPAIVKVVEDQIPDIKNAIPIIKDGWKTTEFWIAPAILLASMIYQSVSGKTLPVDVNATVGALTAIYMVGRQLIKAKAVDVTTK